VNINKTFITGNLLNDPQQKENIHSETYCKFTVMVGNKKDKANVFITVVHGNLGESCYRYLKKGDKVAVVGSIQTRNYEKDGIKFFGFDLFAEHIEFLKWGNKNMNNEDLESMPF